MKAIQISNYASVPENSLYIKMLFYLKSGEVKVSEYLFEPGTYSEPSSDDLAAKCYRDAITKVDKSEVLLEYRKIKQMISGKWVDSAFKYLPMLKTKKGYVTVEA